MKKFKIVLKDGAKADQSDIDADGFSIMDGCLLILRGPRQGAEPIVSIAAGHWVSIAEVPPSKIQT